MAAQAQVVQELDAEVADPQKEAQAIKGNPSHMPEIGDRIMVVKEAWLSLILSGTKTMEVRGKPAGTGHTWIAYDGLVYASAEIAECILLSKDDFEKTRGQHRHIGKAPPFETLYGLVLRNIEELATPVLHYRQPASCNWASFKTQQEDRKPRKQKTTPRVKRSSDALEDAEKQDQDTEEEEPAEADQKARRTSKTASHKTALPHRLPNKK